MEKIKIDNIEDVFNIGIDNEGYKDTKWIEPVFAVALKAVLEDKSVKNYNIQNSYLYNMFNNTYNSNTTYSPIEQITNRGENIDKVAMQLSNVMLKNYPQLSQTDKDDLKDYLFYLFSEMMNNVIDHSGSEIGGFAMAQYYPQNKKIQFAIADRGVGFLENVKLKSNVINEIEAIEKALEKGFTATKTTIYGQEKNAGFGLYAMTEIIKEVQGKFVIISNNGLYRYNTKTDVIQTKFLHKGFKGVIVAFEFEEGNINLSLEEFKRTYLWTTDEEEEEFY